ncbi:asparaginase [Streptomyces sp. N2-109]|uniref:Asparaginase n=1 Tax=Streptomyces gossypii TaxID=2883101 RepID=A0ABT2JYD7_9ACTN|nr:asparaginase [Streptomyces gossypii]MCT2592846.1 asparaginase [Streptomyces gossypii]
MSSLPPAGVPAHADVPPSAGTAAPPVLAEVVRSGFVEGRHRGSLVVLAADGSVQQALGDVTSPVYPRSANKPVQAAAVLHAGLDLAGERLALAAASHSGEAFHLELVERMLGEYGLSEADLQCPPDHPLDPEEQAAHAAAGRPRARIVMNCSGKHTAMLAACERNGWPRDSYLTPGHPLQQLVAERLAALSGEPIAHTGTDGCGAPLLAISLTGLARTFRAVALAGARTPEGRVAAAMRAHPEYIAGTRRHDTWLMRELPGTLSKMGAEAVQAVALPDGRALAFKIEDGSVRALAPVLARVLRSVDVHIPLLDRLAEAPLLGGDARVGEIRAAAF